MLAPSALVKGIVGKLLPSSFVDDRDSDKPARLKRYGEVAISEADSNLYGYCEEGTILLALSATPGTGLTGVTAQTSFSDTGPACYIYNPENPANPNAKSLYLGYIKMIASAAATSTTSQRYAGVLDVVSRAFSVDNTTALTVITSNGNVSPIITPTVKWQNNATVSTLAASSASKRIVCNGCIGGLNIVGDEMIVSFGRGDISAHPGLTAAQAAGVSKRVSNAPPVIVGPGQSFAFHTWGLAQAAAYSPEVEICMWAR